ncbi:ubiquitin carboxyl-terminal hydrolase CYLD isoform X3 [Sesbania bispinosa]|nr:ubiquitin carboxyl-terminal hydrolase CYLD isoform X3 [Sesbania bispinosa]
MDHGVLGGERENGLLIGRDNSAGPRKHYRDLLGGEHKNGLPIGRDKSAGPSKHLTAQRSLSEQCGNGRDPTLLGVDVVGCQLNDAVGELPIQSGLDGLSPKFRHSTHNSICPDSCDDPHGSVRDHNALAIVSGSNGGDTLE